MVRNYVVTQSHCSCDASRSKGNMFGLIILIDSSHRNIHRDRPRCVTDDEEPPARYGLDFSGLNIKSEIKTQAPLFQLCMFLATLFFLAHLISSFFIVIIVIITITNVAGFMHFWGLVRRDSIYNFCQNYVFVPSNINP